MFRQRYAELTLQEKRYYTINHRAGLPACPLTQRQALRKIRLETREKHAFAAEDLEAMLGALRPLIREEAHWQVSSGGFEASSPKHTPWLCQSVQPLQSPKICVCVGDKIFVCSPNHAFVQRFLRRTQSSVGGCSPSSTQQAASWRGT